MVKNKEQIIIIGAGGLAKEVAFIIESLKDFEVFGFISNEGKRNERIYKDFKIVGNDEEAFLKWSDMNFVIAIGDPKIRRKVYYMYFKKGIKRFPKIIHPLSTVANEVEIEEGVIIYPGSKIMPSTKIKKFSIINTNTIIAHDCLIGKFTNLNPSSVINGNVKIGDNVLVGSGAVLHQGLSICDNVNIGIGSVVVRDIKESGTYFGNPTKKLL